MNVRMGILGCADIARRRMLPAMVGLPGMEVVAVASRDAGKAAALAGEFGCRPVHGYARLLERDDIDAVYIPLPAALHARWVEAALRHGKHVLCEKPLTTDPARTAALAALAARAGLALMENVMFVHHGQHAAVRDLVAGGAIGELRALSATFTIPRRPDGDIRYDPTLGGGAVLDLGVYVVRAAMFFLGHDLSVAGAVLRQREVDIDGGILLGGPRGVVAQLAIGLDNAYRCRYELYGSTGRISVDRAFTPPADLVPLVRLDGRPVPLPPDDQVRNTVAAFAQAVRVAAASPADSLCQARLLAAIRDRAGLASP